MSRDATMKATETNTPRVDTNREVDERDECPREELLAELVDDPGLEEEPDGYGHGV